MFAVKDRTIVSLVQYCKRVLAGTISRNGKIVSLSQTYLRNIIVVVIYGCLSRQCKFVVIVVVVEKLVFPGLKV